MSEPAKTKEARCWACGHLPHDGDTCVVMMCYCTRTLLREKPEAASETLTREELSFALMRIFAAGAKGAGEGYHEKVMAHDAALRAELAEKDKEIERRRLTYDELEAKLKKAEEERDDFRKRLDEVIGMGIQDEARASAAEALLLTIAETGGLSVAVSDAKKINARADAAEARVKKLLKIIEDAPHGPCHLHSSEICEWPEGGTPRGHDECPDCPGCTSWKAALPLPNKPQTDAA